MNNKTNAGLFEFIKKSPTAFHAVDTIKNRLLENGFQELKERERWNIHMGGKYFVTRNDSSIIALKIGTELKNYRFQVTASHSDSPAFKIKENAELEIRKKYIQLNTEGYGGMLCAPWFDRPLSIAGRVILNIGGQLYSRLVNIDRDLVMIPNVAIHMNRAVNEGMNYNKQVDMLPLFALCPGEFQDLNSILSQTLQVEKEEILESELFLYNRMEPTLWGANYEFLSAPRLDDLQCAYTTLEGFLSGYNENGIGVYACLDNEEVGSGTKQGAASTFLSDVLKRCNRNLGMDEEQYHCAVASGFLLSCDNAHAVHPNHPEKTDVNNCVYMNEGVVVKFHAGQKYTSDAVSVALFKKICENASVPVQFFANRSDAAGGSTLGNIAMSQVSMNAVDIGLAQLAMHSPYETAGVKDSAYMIKAVEEFYSHYLDVQL